MDIIFLALRCGCLEQDVEGIVSAGDNRPHHRAR